MTKTFNLKTLCKDGDLQKLQEYKETRSDKAWKEEVNIQYQNNSTPLSIVLSNNNYKVLGWLLQNGADPLITTSEGDTILHIAVKYKKESAIAYFKENMLPDQWEKLLNTQNKNQESPLMLAVKRGYSHFVDDLLKNGADIMLKDKTGHTALWFAFELDTHVCDRILLYFQYHVDPNKLKQCINTPNNNQRYLLDEKETAQKWLTEHGADSSITEKGQSTATTRLHKAYGSTIRQKKEAFCTIQ